MAESSRALNAQLVLAAKNGDTNAVNSLIAGGAKVDSVRDGKTALMHAAENGHTDTVSKLVQLRASLTKRSRGHGFKTAVMHAAENGHTDTVSKLVKLGASLTMHDGMTGKTALMYAAQNGHTDTVVKIWELNRSTLLQRTKDFSDSDGFYTTAAYETVAVCLGISNCDDEGRIEHILQDYLNDKKKRGNLCSLGDAMPAKKQKKHDSAQHHLK